jgi:hypothetical protein
MSNPTVTLNPPITADERLLLAAVSRWAHDQGWERDVLPEWYHSRDRLTNIAWGDGTRGALDIEVKADRYGPRLLDVSIPDVTSVRQAVDLLVAFGVLPAWFSSAFAAGMAAGALEVVARS